MAERPNHGEEIPPADEFFPVTRTYGQEEVLLKSHFCTRVGKGEELLGIGIYGRCDLFEVISTPFSWEQDAEDLGEFSDIEDAECFFDDEKLRVEGTGGLVLDFAYKGITGKAEWSDGMDQGREAKDVGYHGEIFGIEFEGLTSKEAERRFRTVVDAHLDSPS